MNPYLPAKPLAAATGDPVQGDVETKDLYEQTAEKFEIYHLHVIHRQPDFYLEKAVNSFESLLPKGHVIPVNLDDISEKLIQLVIAFASLQQNDSSGLHEISWATE